MTLHQHVNDKNDPHETLKKAKQARYVGSYPEDLSAFNDGDLVAVLSTGRMYFVSVNGDAGEGEPSASLVPFAPANAPDSSKADKAVPAAAGNLAALDASGNLADSGKKPSDFAPAGTVTTLVGGDSGKSARTIASEEAASAAQAIIGAGTPAAFDTLKEIADWIADDQAGAAKIVSDVSALQSGKVDKVAGKGLSTNDYTTDEKEKLGDVEAGAKDNVVEAASASGFPASGEAGKIYVAKDTNTIYRWSGTQYTEVSPSPTKPSDIGAQPAGSYASPSDIGIPAFSTSKAGGYAVGDKVVHDNAIWNCIIRHAGSSWTPASWSKLFDLSTDATPTANSSALMTSGGIKNAVDEATKLTPAYSNWEFQVDEHPTETAFSLRYETHSSGGGGPVEGWYPYVTLPESGSSSPIQISSVGKGTPESTSLMWTQVEMDLLPAAFARLTATRKKVDGYFLGNRTDSALADATKVDERFAGKQDALSAAQLANIAAVPNKADSAAIAPAYDPTAAYSVGDVATYDGRRYKCNSAIAAGGETWTAAHWTEESVQAALGDVTPGPDNTKLNSTSAAPAFSSSATYAVDSYCTYNGVLYKCVVAKTTASATTPDEDIYDSSSAPTNHWTVKDMTTPDATLDITSDGRMRVVGANNAELWSQGYNLASASSTTLSCDESNLLTFAATAASAFSDSAAYAIDDLVVYDGKVYRFTAAHAAGAWVGTDAEIAAQALTLPTAPSGKVGDFGLDVDNTANAAVSMSASLTGLDSAFSVVVPKGENLADMLTFAGGELAELYFTLTAFRVNNLPTWSLAKRVVENGGAVS